MRLRLAIRRHSLPETAIVWDVSGEQQLTISNLLEQVNEVVPLESPSDNWGLEDYAVELPGYSGSFECLHFQIVGKVFRDDDEVIIRPLLTQDLRIRRDAGRNQISTDGMKLIDGVPFGKLRPSQGRRINRPEVSIPPLKRRRITYDAEESEEEEEHAYAVEDGEDGNRQLVLKANFEDDDEEDDEDFNPGGNDGEQEEEEDSDDEEDVEDFNAGEGNGDEDVQVDADGDDLMSDGHESDAEEEENPLFNYYDQHGLPKGSIRSGTALEHMAKARNDSSTATAPSKDLSTEKGKGNSRKRNKKVVFDENAEVVSVNNVENANAPKTNNVEVVSVKNLENANAPKTNQSSIDVEEENDAEEEEEEEEDEVEESSSDDSDDDASDDSSDDSDEESDKGSPTGPEADISKENDASENEDVSSDSSSSSDPSSSSDSDSDSGPEEVTSKPTTSGDGVTLNTKVANAQIHSKHAPKVSEKRTVPPYQGTKSTKARNIRRRNTNALNRMREKGIVPAGTTLEDYTKAGLSNVTTMEEAREALRNNSVMDSEVTSKVKTKSTKATQANAEFEARRKQLLESLASGGVEVGPESPQVLPAKTVEEFVAVDENAEMATTISRSKIMPEKDIEAKQTPKKAAPELTEGIPVDPLVVDRADNEIVNQSSAAVESHDPYRPPLGRENCLQGLTFVFTGSLGSMTRPQGRELIAQHGGKVLQNPTTKTDYVVLGSDVGATKLSKIETLKLKTIDKQGLFDLITKSVPASESKPIDAVREIPETPGTSEFANWSVSTTKKQTPNSTSGTTDSEVQARRAKLDVGAGRRMLFGALGIKNPKTKEDEDKIRSNLMKFARPVKAVEELAAPKAQEIDEDPGAWRGKINLRAVECCHDDVVLSEPPFPFVQRWDPQQQGSWGSKGGRGGKRKRNKRNRSDYYDNEPSEKSHKRKRQKSWNHEDYDQTFDVEEEQTYGDGDGMDVTYDEPTAQMNDVNEMELNYDEPLDVDEVMKDDSQAANPDDLPPLPSDLSTLPKLNAGDAKAGMVIAFKHLIMGLNYQPQYSAYKTAVVLKVSASEDLELNLAKRDREQREYDPDTGERIYGQFEMPVSDEDADEEDDAFLNLSFLELSEPLIVHNAPENLLARDVLPTNDPEGSPDGKDGDAEGSQEPNKGGKEASDEKQVSTDNSTTLEHEMAADSPQKSDGTPLDQDSPIKSIEDIPVEKPTDILTEDLLQQSAAGSLGEPDSEVNDPARNPRPTPHEDDGMDVDAQVVGTVLEQTSPTRKEGSSTPRRQNVMEHHIQIQRSDLEQKSPRTPSPGLGGGDGTNDIQIEDSFLGKPTVEKRDHSTPRSRTPVRSNANSGSETSPASITESARHDVSIMIREAGFRSDIDIPSSILRNQQLNVNTPGDAEVFERLMQEMAPNTDRNTYSSPQFNGFASSSPMKAHGEKDLEMSPTPVTWENPTFETPGSNSAGSTSQRLNVESSGIRYPRLQDLSTITSQSGGGFGRQPDFAQGDDSIHPFDEFDSLLNRQDEESSLIRAEAEEFPSAQPHEASQDLPNHVESQPAAIEVRRSPSPKLPEKPRVVSSSNNDAKKKKKKKSPSPFFPSSDSDMPSLEQILSQQPRIKSEPRGSQAPSQPPVSAKSKTDKEYEAAMAKYDAANYDSDMEDIKVPTASQTLPKTFSRIRTSSIAKTSFLSKKVENRRASASQVPRALKELQPYLQSPPRVSQAPPRSQMIDLTLSSDPEEPEPEPEFQTAPEHDYDDDGDDGEYTGPLGSGWVDKKSVRGRSVEPSKARRVTSANERISSTQGAVGKGKRDDGGGRRKTTTRF